MKKYFTQIVGVFFIVIFLSGVMAALMPLLSFQSSKQDIVELLAKTESENSGKEKEEKIPEKDLINQRIDLQLPFWDAIVIKKHSYIYSASWRNVCLAKFTPPPEQR